MLWKASLDENCNQGTFFKNRCIAKIKVLYGGLNMSKIPSAISTDWFFRSC